MHGLGHPVTRAQAAALADAMLDGRHPRDRAAYVLGAIRRDPAAARRLVDAVRAGGDRAPSSAREIIAAQRARPQPGDHTYAEGAAAVRAALAKTAAADDSARHIPTDDGAPAPDEYPF